MFLHGGDWKRESWHGETCQRGTRSNSGVRAPLNPICWTIRELNPVCHDSTAALRPIVACSFCVQSAILSALIWRPYSRGTTTVAAADRTKRRTDRRQQRQPQGRRNRQRQPQQQPQTTVAKCASWRHAGFALVPCGHVLRFCETCAMRVLVMDGNILFVVRILYHGNACFPRWQTMQKYTWWPKK